MLVERAVPGPVATADARAGARSGCSATATGTAFAGLYPTGGQFDHYAEFLRVDVLGGGGDPGGSAAVPRRVREPRHAVPRGDGRVHAHPEGVSAGRLDLDVRLVPVGCPTADHRRDARLVRDPLRVDRATPATRAGSRASRTREDTCFRSRLRDLPHALRNVQGRCETQCGTCDTCVDTQCGHLCHLRHVRPDAVRIPATPASGPCATPATRASGPATPAGSPAPRVTCTGPRCLTVAC